MTRDQALHITIITTGTADKYAMVVGGVKKCIPQLAFLRIVVRLEQIVTLIVYASKTHKC